MAKRTNRNEHKCKHQDPIERVAIEVTIGCTVQAYGTLTLNMPVSVLNASEATRNSYIERTVKRRMYDVDTKPNWSGSDQFRIVQALGPDKRTMLEDVNL